MYSFRNQYAEIFLAGMAAYEANFAKLTDTGVMQLIENVPVLSQLRGGVLSLTPEELILILNEEPARSSPAYEPPAGPSSQPSSTNDIDE